MDCVTRDGSFCARSFSAFFGKSKKEPTRFEKLWKEGTKKIISEHRVEKFKENMKKESIETMQQMQRESASRASSKSLDASSSESAGRIGTKLTEHELQQCRTRAMKYDVIDLGDDPIQKILHHWERVAGKDNTELLNRTILPPKPSSRR
eukprot:GEMP01088680.1.p1 GENE.GEMP01088680.1~~GEMP01088680.1.p1  ORF type:complete len:150 (+),score=25.51 GEMP01088680.1:106-555(+)